MGGLVKICLVLTAAFFVIGSAAIGIARLTSHGLLASDPAALPKQSISALKDYSCLLSLSETGDSGSVFCEFTEPHSSDDSPVKTWVIQSNDLDLGDLFACLGAPTGVQPMSLGQAKGLINIFWGDQPLGAIANPNDEQLDYFLPIRYLSMESKASLCPST